MNPAKNPAKTSAKPVVDPDKWLRLKLITSLGGDVVRAQVALEFVHGNPEASERYRRFKEWEQQNFQDYCREKGFKGGSSTYSKGPSPQLYDGL